MPDIAPIVQALQMRNWYALAALGLLLLVQLSKTPVLGRVWAKIPDGWRTYSVLVAGAVAGFTAAFQDGKPFSEALLAAVGGALSISLGAMGLNAALTDSHLPWNGGAGGKEAGKVEPPDHSNPPAFHPRGGGPAVALLFAAALALTGGTACSSTGAKPAETGAQAAALAKSVHAGAVLAVKVVNQVATVWIDSRPAPTPSELEVMRAVVGALGKARDVLNAAGDIDAKIVEVAKQLRLATDMLAAVGVTPPKEATPVLEFLESYARSRGGAS